MRSLIVLILVWLAFQFGALLLHGRSDTAAAPPRVTTEQIDEALSSWPEHSRELAKRMVVDFGPPDGAHENVIWWTRGGDARIVIYRDERDAPPPPATQMAGTASGG